MGQSLDKLHTEKMKMSKLSLCMLCLVMQVLQGRKISGEDSFLTRVKRASCDPEGAQSCALEATQTFMAAMFDENNQPKAVPAGEKPDYQERKTCNFLIDTEKCFEKLESCSLPAGNLKAMKDKAFKQARDAAKQLPNWDDEKCQSAGASFATSLFLVLVLAGFASKV